MPFSGPQLLILLGHQSRWIGAHPLTLLSLHYLWKRTCLQIESYSEVPEVRALVYESGEAGGGGDVTEPRGRCGLSGRARRKKITASPATVGSGYAAKAREPLGGFLFGKIELFPYFFPHGAHLADHWVQYLALRGAEGTACCLDGPLTPSWGLTGKEQ